MFRRLATFAFTLLILSPAFTADPRSEYHRFILSQAQALRAKEAPPSTRKAWDERREALRSLLQNAWGDFPATPCPLDAKKLGELKREGYTVEKLIFQTLPGVWMTANAYVPQTPGKKPGILMVHGHWKGAKQDPVVQSRCIGAAKLGFFVLVVDAFGAGERAVGKALGEYHGEMTAATLFPLGRPLSGLQVYENMRAVDYLQSRPEVDASRIGITGASGGGNQTMYAGGWDDRYRAVVPVCSVGNYQAYLSAACCMCEVVPGALRFTEEGDVLGLAAPRGLMVVSATKDAPQFSVAEAKKSVARAEAIYKLVEASANVRHPLFESPHAYNQPMREAMYGWMTKQLKGEGDGKPIPEPAFKTEEPEALRCFPGNTRPDDYLTIPRFAAREARALLAKPLATAEEVNRRRTALVKEVLGGFPNVKPTRSEFEEIAGGHATTIQPEPGLNLRFTSKLAAKDSKKDDPTFYLILSLDGVDSPARVALEKAALEAGDVALSYELRATGKLALEREVVGKAPDHNSSQWALWIGRPLLGQWVFDVRQLLNFLEAEGTLPRNLVVIGEGPAGLVALAASASDPRIKKVAAVNTLSSYITEVPYVGQRLGTMAPGLLKLVGDVPHLAGLSQAKNVVIAGGVTGDGKSLKGEALKAAYRPTVDLSKTAGTTSPTIQDETNPEAVLRALK